MKRTEEQTQELIEANYIRGQRSVLVRLLNEILCELDVPYYKNIPDHNLELIARMTLEREEAIAALRELCDEHGDNEWKDNLYLPDIINKHLANHLNAPE